MDSDLVSSAGFQMQADKGMIFFDGKGFIMGNGGLSLRRYDHLFSVCRVRCQRGGDFSCGRGRYALRYSQIVLL